MRTWQKDANRKPCAMVPKYNCRYLQLFRCERHNKISFSLNHSKSLFTCHWLCRTLIHVHRNRYSRWMKKEKRYMPCFNRHHTNKPIKIKSKCINIVNVLYANVVHPANQSPHNILGRLARWGEPTDLLWAKFLLSHQPGFHFQRHPQNCYLLGPRGQKHEIHLQQPWRQNLVKQKRMTTVWSGHSIGFVNLPCRQSPFAFPSHRYRFGLKFRLTPFFI